MEAALNFRLQLLRDSGQITQKMYEAVELFLNEVENDYKFKITEDNAAMMVTHFAVALSRIENGNTVNKMDDLLLAQLMGAKGYNVLPQYLLVIENHMGFKIPEEEIGYIAAHFCLLMEREA